MNSILPGDLRDIAYNEQICSKNINRLLGDKRVPPIRLLRFGERLGRGKRKYEDHHPKEWKIIYFKQGNCPRKVKHQHKTLNFLKWTGIKK